MQESECKLQQNEGQEQGPGASMCAGKQSEQLANLPARAVQLQQHRRSACLEQSLHRFCNQSIYGKPLGQNIYSSSTNSSTNSSISSNLHCRV
jgi:hypothetical protein